MVVTRQGFTRIVATAFAGLGFPAEGPSIYEFPTEMFVQGGDLSPINRNIDRIIYGLTRWQPDTRKTGTFARPKVTVTGRDYDKAVTSMNFLFLRNSWGDGLPLVPPTEQRVNWILTGTDLAPSTVLGTVAPRAGIATVESVAVALAMSGGRPEYLPVLIAAVEAITDPGFGLWRINPTTCGVYPAVIVNGPAAAQIRLSSGYGVMGPDPQHPAAGPIGRALRLVQQNLGGAIPGTGTMAIFGAMRHINAVLAEDEDGLPPGWQPLSVERGFPRGANVLTVTPVSSATNILLSTTDSKTAKGAAREYLSTVAGFMRTPNSCAFTLPRTPDLPSGVVLIGRSWAAELAKVGYSKEALKAFLWENSKLPWAEAERTGLTTKMLIAGLPKDEPAPVAGRPEWLMLVIAGGMQSGQAYWMQTGNQTGVVSEEIRLPRRWDSLLEEAEKDLYSRVSCEDQAICPI
ncbi:MAG: hypothetical protein HY673_08850 [Chloroflexi bacterium]|nr:hypothetical protein [Chloroflexota bacterium]